MPTAVSPQRESPCAKAEDQSVRDAMLAQQKDALDALDTAVRGIVAVQSRLGMDLERQLVVLAGRIARRVVHREVSLDPAVLLALAREGMNALGASKGVVVRIGRVEDPGLIESLQLRLEDYAPDARLIIEAGRPPGYCTVEAEAGSVDESVDTRLDNVLRNLIGDASVDEG
jgi:flagellar assembly protein FliH